MSTMLPAIFTPRAAAPALALALATSPILFAATACSTRFAVSAKPCGEATVIVPG